MPIPPCHSAGQPLQPPSRGRQHFLGPWLTIVPSLNLRSINKLWRRTLSHCSIITRIHSCKRQWWGKGWRSMRNHLCSVFYRHFRRRLKMATELPHWPLDVVRRIQRDRRQETGHSENPGMQVKWCQGPQGGFSERSHRPKSLCTLSLINCPPWTNYSISLKPVVSSKKL